jgi:hypothetical protein
MEGSTSEFWMSAKNRRGTFLKKKVSFDFWISLPILPLSSSCEWRGIQQSGGVVCVVEQRKQRKEKRKQIRRGFPVRLLPSF